MDQSHDHLLSLAAKIVSAHIGNHDTATEALPALIRQVYQTLREVQPDHGTGGHNHAHAPGRTSPAAHQAAERDQLTCMECGLSMKMLKRHLITVHGLTPEEYREKWNLPDDYPMVTADYARLRSSLAKQSGLGKRPDAKSKSSRGRGRTSAG